DRRLRRARRQRRREMLGDLGVLPALDAVHDDEAAPDRERQGPQRERRVERRRALEHLDRGGAARALGERPEPRAALADAAVVVAVDQVGRLEAGRHAPRLPPAAGAQLVPDAIVSGVALPWATSQTPADT